MDRRLIAKLTKGFNQLVGLAGAGGPEDVGLDPKDRVSVAALEAIIKHSAYVDRAILYHERLILTVAALAREIDYELKAAGPDEVKQHPMFRCKARVNAKARKLLAEIAKG